MGQPCPNHEGKGVQGFNPSTFYAPIQALKNLQRDKNMRTMHSPDDFIGAD
jgi:hypothetical protein